MTTFKVDHENNSEDFFDALHEYDRGDVFSGPVQALLADGEVEITNAAGAEAFASWLREHPGWSDPDAPDYAPHPVLIQ